MIKFIGTGKKVKISNFFPWFWLKDKFLDQKTDTAVSCPDSEGLWEVSAKSDFLFANQESDFAETFYSPSLSGQKTDVSVFCSSNLSFTQNQVKKFEISTFSKFCHFLVG